MKYKVELKNEEKIMLKKYREVQEHADFCSALLTRCYSSKYTENLILDYNVVRLFCVIVCCREYVSYSSVSVNRRRLESSLTVLCRVVLRLLLLHTTYGTQCQTETLQLTTEYRMGLSRLNSFRCLITLFSLLVRSCGNGSFTHVVWWLRILHQKIIVVKRRPE